MSAELASGKKEREISTLFKDASLLSHKGEAVGCIAGLKDRTVLLYFATSGVEPCRSFSKLLSSFYDLVRESGDDSIAVMVVSSDSSRQDESMHPDWLMVEWAGDIQEIMDLYRVERTPWLLVADKDAKAVVNDAHDALSDIFTDSHGHMRPMEEAKDAIAAKWLEWRRLAGDWCTSTGPLPGSASMSSACPAAAASTAASCSQASAQSDRDALRASRLALDSRAACASSAAPATSGSASSSSAPAPLQAPALQSAAAASRPTAVDVESGDRIELPPLIPPAPSPDDEVASDMASDGGRSVREDLDGDMAMEAEEAVARVVAMGFPEDQARGALQVANGDPDRAVALLLGDA